MADEIKVQTSLSITKGHLTHQSSPTNFQATMVGQGGPTPGQLLASLDGISVDLSVLGTPGMCSIQNLDATNYIQVGIWESDSSIFYPFMELLPGEIYVFRLARNIREEYAGTGTGTTAYINTLRIKAFGAACKVVVNAFEK